MLELQNSPSLDKYYSTERLCSLDVVILLLPHMGWCSSRKWKRALDSCRQNENLWMASQPQKQQMETLLLKPDIRSTRCILHAKQGKCPHWLPQVQQHMLELKQVEVRKCTPKEATSPTGTQTKWRLHTVEWVSKTNSQARKPIVDKQDYDLRRIRTSKRRIRIHIRQHFCVHFFHCRFQHGSRDPVTEHHKGSRTQTDHCGLDMREEDIGDLRHIGWATKKTLGPY